MSLRSLGLRVSKPPADLVTKVQAAIDGKGKEREVSMDDSESVVSSEHPAVAIR